ncbi:MAG: ATP-binding protein [Nannocystaceae bacterium]|nr:ATP-binding protein [bacterium]
MAGDSPLADDASRQREIDRLRATVEALRNPAGAVRLAAQMLAGPMRAALRGASEAEAACIADVLGALESATAELTRILAHMGSERPAAELVVLAKPECEPGLEALVAAVRRTLEERVSLRASVESVVEPGLRPDVDPKDLQAALFGLVQNAMESMARRRPDGAPWQVQMRASLEPAGPGTHHVVFDIRDRGDGLPPGVMRWLCDATGLSDSAADGPGMSLRLARRVAEGAGGTLEASRVGGTTRVRLSVPQR